MPGRATDPKVSVIMNCLNGEKYVKAAIDSVYAQGYPNWEIIFLDNASTDHTQAIARSYDARLRYFRNERTVPLGEARNLALKQATGDFVAFLDSDDLWQPDKLEKQIPLFHERPQLGLVFSDSVLLFQDTGKSTTYFRSHRYKPPRGRIFASLLTHYSIPMLTAVVRIDALRAMGQWFDSSYQVCDDFDFFMRLSYEWECDFLDVPLATCRIHGDAVTAKMHQYGPGEMIRTLEKFRSRHPDFEKNFGKEAKVFLMQVSYKKGKSCWRQGNVRAARDEFRKHLYRPKFLLSYLGTLLPYSTFAEISTRLRHLRH